MPDPSPYDVIVLGVGSMGAAAAYHLAQRGHRVLGLEPHNIPHAHGSHHGRSRMIRQSYYEHPDYVPLLQRAYALWDELQQQSDRDIIQLTGAVYFGTPDGCIVPGARTAATKHHLPHALLDDPDKITKRFPAFTVPSEFHAFHEDKAGYLVPENVVHTHAELARNHGAELHSGEPVTAWKATPAGVEVTTPQNTYHAAHLVISAGAWAGQLLQDLDIKLQVTRQVLAWFHPRDNPETFTLGNFPCWFIENDSPFGHYGFPIAPGHEGLKIALHKPCQPIDPDTLHHENQQATEAEIDSLQQVLRDFIPGAAGPLLDSAVCLYTNSPDGDFIVGPHPAHENVTVACGFSGHGFKFASVIGEILADLAASGRTDHPIGFLSPVRFVP